MNYNQLTEEITQGGVIVVDFYQNECRFCDMLKPQLQEAIDTTGVQLIAINLSDLSEEERAEMTEEFSLMATPTVVIFQDEEEVDRFSGFLPAAAIEARIIAL